MRDIKFRAWDSRNKIMYHSDCSHKEYLSFSSAEGLSYWQVDFDSSRRQVLLDSNSGFLMQFTELRDRNGKEGYEDDIIKWPNGLIERVVFEPQEGWNFGTHCEIIGNIHEHPELLNTK